MRPPVPPPIYTYYDASCKVIAIFRNKEWSHLNPKYTTSTIYALREQNKSPNYQNFLQKKSYTITKAITPFAPFKTGDALQISQQDGLKHFRKGKLLHTYKIIPQKISLDYGKDFIIGYYVDALKTIFVARSTGSSTEWLFFHEAVHRVILPVHFHEVEWEKRYELN